MCVCVLFPGVCSTSMMGMPCGSPGAVVEEEFLWALLTMLLLDCSGRYKRSTGIRPAETRILQRIHSHEPLTHATQQGLMLHVDL